jgi:tetratricopeptide (TPR) repeat protein
MKKLLGIFLAAACSTVSLLAAIDPTLAQAQWKDPAFVKSFLGSYGFLAEYEPRISEKERAFFNQLIELIPQDAQAAIEAVTSHIRPESSAAFDFILANLYFQQSALEQASQHYQQAIAKFPSFRRAYKNLGLVQVQQGEFEAAVSSITRAIALGEVEGRSYGLLGYSYQALGQYHPAESAYRQALLMQPKERDWQIGLAACLQQQQRYAETIALLDLLLEAYPDNADYWLLQSNAYLGLNQPEKAAQNIELVRRMGRAQLDSLKLLGDIYINQQSPDLAVSAYLAAMQLAELKDLDIVLRAADALTQTGNYDQATRLTQDTRQKFGSELDGPLELKLLTLEAQIARATGQLELALAQLEQIIERDALNGDALIELANCYAEQGDMAKAINRYQQAEKMETFQRKALIAQAQARVRQNDYLAALPLLRRALQIEFDQQLADFTQRVQRAAKN